MTNTNIFSKKDHVFETIVQQIREYCDNNPDDYRSRTVIAPITEKTKLQGFILKFDECDIIQLCNDIIEPYFGIKIQLDKNTRLKTVGDLCNCVKDCLKTKPITKVFAIDNYGQNIYFCKNVLGFFPVRRETLEKELKELLYKQYISHKVNITNNSDLRHDLNVNSLDMAEIIVEHEKKYGCFIDIPLEKISTFTNLCDILYASIVEHASKTYEDYKKNNVVNITSTYSQRQR